MDKTPIFKPDIIAQECRQLLVTQMTSTAVVSVTGAGILVLVLRGIAEQNLLNTWFMLMFVVNLARLILVIRYRRTVTTQKQQKQWYRLLIILTSGIGFIWGIGGVLFMQQEPLSYQVFITFMVAGMTAGAVATYTASIVTYTAFALPASLPISFWLLLQESRIQLAMGTMVLLFTVALWVSARRHHKTLLDSLRLQLEKDGLIKQLRDEARTLKDAHKALLATEEKYKDLYDNAPDMYVSVDAQNITVLQCNQTLANRLGYCKDEIIGQPVFNLYHPNCHEEVEALCHTFADTGEIHNAALQLRRRNGTAIDVILDATAVCDEEGNVLYSRSSWRDVSESKDRERFESDQQQILKKIIDKSIPLGEILEDVVSAIQHQQPGMLGSILLLDETGKHLRHGAAPDLPADYCHAIDNIAIGEKVGSCGTAAYRKERVIVSDIATDPLWADYRSLALKYGLAACWSQPVKDAAGQVLGTFALYHRQPCSPNEREIRLIERAAALAANVIKVRREEQALARLAEILQATSDFVAMADVNGRITFVNKAGRQMMGFGENEDLSDLSIADFHSPDVAQRLIHTVLPALEKTGTWRGQTVFLCRNGNEIITDQILIAHWSKEGEITHYSTVARDITAHIKAEQEQARLQAQIEHTQRLESMGVLAGGIAHDFNNILTAIMGNASMAEHKALKDPQATQQYLANIVTSSERAAELCKQMLAYSGKGKFVVKVIDLSAMVDEITRLLEVSIEKNVVLKYHLTENLPTVEADVAQMQQVIMNLVINASDAIGDKSGLISIATGIMYADKAYLAETCLDDQLSEGRYVYLEISDTGCGMNKEIQAKLFEPFFTTKFTGHGLGMSAVLGIVRGHHGAIKVYSEPERGTTFKVLLPVCEQPAHTISSPATSTDAWCGSGTVLVVDDEETIREIAVMMLEDMGFATLTAVNGEDGVRVYREHQNEIIVVLMDMTMPKMDGKTCFTELRRINKAVKVVLSSGYNEQEATSRFTGQGLAGFIQKPYTPEQLGDVISSITTTKD